MKIVNELEVLSSSVKIFLKEINLYWWVNTCKQKILT